MAPYLCTAVYLAVGEGNVMHTVTRTFLTCLNDCTCHYVTFSAKKVILMWHVIKAGLDWTVKPGLGSFVKHGLDSFVKHGLDSFCKTWTGLTFKTWTGLIL